MRTAKELARYMQPALDEARMERQWERLRDFREKSVVRRPRVIAFALAVACLFAGLVVAFRWSSVTAPLPTEGTLVETSATNVQPLTLADGSRVLLSESSRVRLSTVRPEAVKLVLTRGAVSLDVAHDKKRSFTVSAGGYDLVVHGTRFSVTLLPGATPAVRVSVEEGRVEARDARTSRTESFITTGQSWTSGAPLAQAPLPPKPDEEAIPEASAAAPNRRAPAASDGATTTPTPEAPKARAEEATETEQGPGAFAREVSRSDARHLLDLANAARLAGRPRDAAVALDELCKNHRGDPRAGLAALELGRLRADSFGDLKGALSAFDDAVRLASGSVREDAEARRVLTLEALGDFASCRSARDAYLAKFPNGIRAGMIRGRCAAK